MEVIRSSYKSKLGITNKFVRLEDLSKRKSTTIYRASTVLLFVIVLIIPIQVIGNNNGNFSNEMKINDTTIYDLKIILVKVYVLDDHDDGILGAGEIFCKTDINGDDYETEHVDANDGEYANFNVQIYRDWCYELDISIEVKESDYDFDDSLGKYEDVMRPSNGTKILTTDTQDAQIYLNIIILERSSQGLGISGTFFISSTLVVTLFLITKRKRRINETI